MNKKQKTKIGVFAIIIFIVLLVYCISIIFPVIWGFLTSLKASVDFGIMGNVIGLPNAKFSANELRFANYLRIFKRFTIATGNNSYYSALFGKIEILPKRVDFWGLIINTIVYAVACAIIGCFSNMTIAYLCAKFDYAFSRFWYSLLLILMIIPIVGSGPSMLTIVRNLGIYDTYASMVVMHVTCGGVYFFVFYACMKGIPSSFIEAAEIDGASQMAIYVRIIIPLASKILFTVSLISFIGLWNDYQTPLLYYPSKPTLAYGVYSMSGATSGGTYDTTSLPQRVAGCMILATPLIILFIACKNVILGNLSMGGLKE